MCLKFCNEKPKTSNKSFKKLSLPLSLVSICHRIELAVSLSLSELQPLEQLFLHPWFPTFPFHDHRSPWNSRKHRLPRHRNCLSASSISRNCICVDAGRLNRWKSNRASSEAPLKQVACFLFCGGSATRNEGMRFPSRQSSSRVFRSRNSAALPRAALPGPYFFPGPSAWSALIISQTSLPTVFRLVSFARNQNIYLGQRLKNHYY